MDVKHRFLARKMRSTLIRVKCRNALYRPYNTGELIKLSLCRDSFSPSFKNCIWLCFQTQLLVNSTVVCTFLFTTVKVVNMTANCGTNVIYLSKQKYFAIIAIWPKQFCKVMIVFQSVQTGLLRNYYFLPAILCVCGGVCVCTCMYAYCKSVLFLTLHFDFHAELSSFDLEILNSCINDVT